MLPRKTKVSILYSWYISNVNLNCYTQYEIMPTPQSIYYVQVYNQSTFLLNMQSGLIGFCRMLYNAPVHFPANNWFISYRSSSRQVARQRTSYRTVYYCSLLCCTGYRQVGQTCVRKYFIMQIYIQKCMSNCADETNSFLSKLLKHMVNYLKLVVFGLQLFLC